ncbi:hypothetical protein A606_10370 [Corynebacterium terpenotabidum Y-11]|uniref:Uncharacterized protein n=2 Tax=Corynebacterium terpenotabidum TaxID=89154 RepID=S4XM47_9CORY|nr:hypothetical protein A606_10370 [Corynebacterium terpenotabidum Y-11]
MGPGTPPAVFYKKRWVAALFSFFWSSIGAANWYLGNYYRALAQMIVGGTGILVAQLGPLVVISGKGFEATAGMHVPLIFGLFLWSVVLIWGFVEFIMILGGFGPYRRDARGYDLV